MLLYAGACDKASTNNHGVYITQYIIVTKSELGPIDMFTVCMDYFEFDLTLDLLASKCLMSGCML